ncbi:MAG: DUF72 domain-containing protein [Bacillus sp. (in: firmicutes)]
MIYIGLTGWGDHDALYGSDLPAKQRLQAYSEHFPTVEVDASFYAVQPRRNVEKWLSQTPASFRFIVKAYQGMTGHIRGEIPFPDKGEMFTAYLESIVPYKEQGKLAMVLFQFPPWFECNRENVNYLRWCKEKMGDCPVALEFRNQTWFSEPFYEKTLSFMEQSGWIHSICDEPQAGSGSVPTVLYPTHPDKTLVRFHGRNVHGWNKTGSNEEWRAVRFLYRYNKKELLEWKKHLLALQNKTKDIYVVFNNNSGGDAADNARELIEAMNIAYTGLAPRQMDLF